MRKLRLISRLDLAVLLGVVFAVFMANVAAFGQECDQLRGQVLRLHILANSDSEEDQALKLRVRDRVLEATGGLFSSPQSEADAKEAAQGALPVILSAAKQVLRESGVDEPVAAQICNMYFTTRQYGELSLPAGYYDAVRITIGAGAGHNWWCVMYPPLCVPAARAERLPETQEIQQLNGEPMFRPKLAVVELFEGAVSALKG